MKFNKWTLGLAAVGVVSMASAVNADETKLSPLQTALSTTTISGAVDVAAQYNPGDAVRTDNNKADNFSVNTATISLDKPLDEAPWAAGYHIDLNAGSDAINGLNYNSDGNNDSVALRQAYVALRTPVGNGIDWKIGAFDGVTGYESNTGYLNPNYTRSYGYAMNPGSEVGILGSYKFCDAVAVQMGMADTHNPIYDTYTNGKYRENLTSHDYIGTVALTAPDSFGFLKGSVLNLGTVQSFEGNGVNVYSVNATFMTPVTGLKFGLAYDKRQALSVDGNDGNVFGVYATYQATQKLGFNLRAEYVDGKNLGDLYYNSNTEIGNGKGEEVTATIEYDLWANVLTRVEARWDHLEYAEAFNNNNTADEYLLALNVVYKF